MTHYTSDWFSLHIPVWQETMKLLPGHRDFLEIGSFEGRSCCWLLQNALADDGTMTCIDPYEDDYSGKWEYWPEAKGRFLNNTQESKKAGQTIKLIEKPSSIGLSDLISQGAAFDLIYVDGTHTAPGAMSDCCLSYALLKPGGLMLIDDYLWGEPRLGNKRPKPGVDAFVNCFAEKLAILHNGHQVILKKL